MIRYLTLFLMYFLSACDDKKEVLPEPIPMVKEKQILRAPPLDLPPQFLDRPAYDVVLKEPTEFEKQKMQWQKDKALAGDIDAPHTMQQDARHVIDGGDHPLSAQKEGSARNQELMDPESKSNQQYKKIFKLSTKDF